MVRRRGSNCGFISILTVIFAALLLSSPIRVSAEELPPDIPQALSSPVPQASTSTGAAVTSIPIVVPPGRNGLAPNIALTYNSQGGNGIVGVGWSLDMGAIQRSTKYGVNYGSGCGSNDFVAVMGGGAAELVARSDWGTCYFGARIEGEFSKYYFNAGTGGWEVTAKNGTKYYYGTTSASRQDNANGIFKWLLDKVQDTNGNYMTISYTKDGYGEIYLNRIDYTGNGSLDPSNYVQFYYEDRTDVYPSYLSNSEVKTAWRLKTIDVASLVGGRSRQYVLSYDDNNSRASGRSLLTGVTQWGSDLQAALPAVTFDYPSLDPAYNAYLSPEAWGTHRDITLASDFNGDGRHDILYFKAGVYGGEEPTPGSLSVGLSNGATFDWSHWADTAIPASNVINSSAKSGDFNGDGCGDVVVRDEFILIQSLNEVGLSNCVMAFPSANGSATFPEEGSTQSRISMETGRVIFWPIATARHTLVYQPALPLMSISGPILTQTTPYNRGTLTATGKATLSTMMTATARHGWGSPMECLLLHGLDGTTTLLGT